MIHQQYYVAADEAAALLRERQYLRGEVESYWAEQGVLFPQWLRELKPSALWARQLVSWRFEDAVFADTARAAKLPTVWMRLTSDRFTEVSSLKRSYLHPQMATGLDRNGGIITRRQRLGDMRRWNGLALSDITLKDGQILPAWHQARWERGYGQGTIVECDDIKLAWGSQVNRYYLALMSMLIAHGVLFEDYHGGESGDNLDSFTADVFEPAFALVKERFGVQPLIVKMPWWPELSLYPSDEWISLATAKSIPRAA